MRDGDFIKLEFKQTKVLTNKFGLFATILVCLSEFGFVCQTFGLFASNLKSGRQTKILTNNTIRQNKNLHPQKRERS